MDAEAAAAAAKADANGPVTPDRAAQSKFPVNGDKQLHSARPRPRPPRPVNDEMCAARLLRGTQYLSERYCDVSRLPHQSSGRFIVLANCGHHPARLHDDDINLVYIMNRFDLL